MCLHLCSDHTIIILLGVQLEFEIEVQFCFMYLNFCRDYNITILFKLRMELIVLEEHI